MGNTQATAAGETPTRTLIIDEWEVPEAYKAVAVSDEVVDAVSGLTPKSPTSTKIVVTPDPHLRFALFNYFIHPLLNYLFQRWTWKAEKPEQSTKRRASTTLSTSKTSTDFVECREPRRNGREKEGFWRYGSKSEAAIFPSSTRESLFRQWECKYFDFFSFSSKTSLKI